MTAAGDRWRAMVEAEEQQTRGVRDPSWDLSGDFWRPLAAFFRDDPRREGDPVVGALGADLGREDVLLDIGAGGGRYALPLALRVREVIAVEPSESMRAALTEQAAESGITNVRVVESRWEDAPKLEADAAFASHVTYTAREIEDFLLRMSRAARRWAAVVVFADPPQFALGAFWPLVHGQERLRLPCLRELLDVLWSLDIYPDVTMLPPVPVPAVGAPEDAHDRLRYRLFVTPGTAADERLATAMERLLVEDDGKLVLRDRPLHRPAVVRWATGGQELSAR